MDKRKQYQRAFEKTAKAYLRLIGDPKKYRDLWYDRSCSACRFCTIAGVDGLDLEGCFECPLTTLENGHKKALGCCEGTHKLMDLSNKGHGDLSNLRVVAIERLRKIVAAMLNDGYSLPFAISWRIRAIGAKGLLQRLGGRHAGRKNAESL